MTRYLLVCLMIAVLALPVATATAGNGPDILATDILTGVVLQSLPSAAPEATAAGYRWRRDTYAQNNVITSKHPPDPPKLDAIAPDQVIPWEHMPQKSYLIPALEVSGFLVLLNLYDRIAYPNQRQDGKKVYSSTLSSTWDHLRKQNWVFDQDPFNINQFAHPYQGATMYGLARSCGLGFWESLAYTRRVSP